MRTICAVALAWSMTGCFTMHHRFPPNTHFGRRPEGAVGVRPATDVAMKNYLLSGLLPWTSFGTKDLAKDPGPGRQLADVEVKTEFDTFDFIVTLVPGACCYGYYIWAPRHVGYEAVVIDNESEVVPAVH